MGLYIRYFLLFFISLFALLSCGEGGSLLSEVLSHLSIKVTPNPVLVIKVDRNISLSEDEKLSLSAPNTQFQIHLDNTGGQIPVTIIQAIITVIGPGGSTQVSIDPLSNMFYVDPSNGRIEHTERSVIVEVRRYQKAACMSKKDYFGVNESVLCTSIPDDTEAGKSAAGTTESYLDSSQCCHPFGSINSLENIWFYVGGLGSVETGSSPGGEDSHGEDNGSGSMSGVYSFTMQLIGWVGPVSEPLANFSAYVRFNSSAN